MKKAVWAVLAAAFSVSANASPSFQPTGSTLTQGASSLGNNLLSQGNNPASMAWGMEKRKHGFAFGFLDSVGVGVEIGQVDNFIDDIDRLSSELDKNNLTLDDANRIIADFQELLVTMGDVGYVTTGASVHLPLMPIAVRLPHSSALMLDANVTAQARMSVLDAPITFNPISSTLETSSALYIKGARIDEISLSYSRKLGESAFGNLYTGLRAKYFRVGLTKSILSVSDTGGDASTAVEDRISTDFTENDAFGVDLGAMLVSNHYTLGATFNNINAPSFAYNNVGQNCNALSAELAADCHTAFSHSTEIDLNETHTFNPQLRMDGALHTRNKHWMLMTSVDANAINDPVGNEVQWLVASVAYLSPNRLIPTVRTGYRANLAGSQMSYATFGFSLFRLLHLDAAYGLESVVIDGSEIPRGAAFNLGIDLGF